MSAADKTINVPFFSGRWCDTSGNLTPLAQTTLRALMNRTGYAVGISSNALQQDVNDVQGLANAAESDALTALLTDGSCARLALARAQEALQTALIALARAQAREMRMERILENAMMSLAAAQRAEAKSAKALETASDSAIFAITARQQ